MNVFANTYVHALEGRLRIKLPRIKRAAREALEVELRLQEIAGVEEVSANLTTGNVLIQYNHAIIKQSEIISFLSQSGYFPQTPGGSGISAAPSAMERLTASVAAIVMEAVLARLITGLI